METIRKKKKHRKRGETKHTKQSKGSEDSLKNKGISRTFSFPTFRVSMTRYIA